MKMLRYYIDSIYGEVIEQCIGPDPDLFPDR